MGAEEAPEHIKADWPGSAWIVELLASGSRNRKPFQTKHLFISSLRTTPEALLRMIRERWSIGSWQWIRDTQLHEDRHRYRGNGAGVLAAMRTAALNLLSMARFDSIREGLSAVMHDIRALLAMAMRQPQEKPS
jgi:predicted transposase YbfD/YdcC